MKLPIYVIIPTERQHLRAMRLSPFTRCVRDVSRAGLAKAKPSSCFSPGAALRYRACKEVYRRVHAVEEEAALREDLMRRITDLCTLANALGDTARAAEALLSAGERDEAGGLVIDEGEATKVRAAIAWAQNLAREAQKRLEAPQ